MIKIQSQFSFLILIFSSVSFLNFDIHATEKNKNPSNQVENYKWNYSIGFGSSMLNFKINENLNYQASNSSHLNLGGGQNVFNIGFKIPFKDPEETIKNSVDSKVEDYQLSFKLHPQFVFDLYYQKYKGYFVNAPNSTGFALPDLQQNHYGVQGFYIFNPEHPSYQFYNSSDTFLENSGSWIISFGYDQFSIHGDLIPTIFQNRPNQTFNDAKINSIILRGGYSYNWNWPKWFLGLAAGYGLNYYNIKTDTVGETTKSDLSYHLAMAYGYKLEQSKIGFYGRMYNVSFEISDIKYSSQSGQMGLYFMQSF